MQVISRATGKVVDTECRPEAQAKQTYYRKRNFFTPNNAVSLGTKKSLIKSFVWSVRGTETWTKPKTEKAKIEAILKHGVGEER